MQESRPLDALFDSTYANSASAVRPPLAASSTAAAVAGGKRHHHHHHYRPRVPHAALIPAEVLLAPQPRVDPTIPDAVDDRRTVDAGIQTVYRESESQTNPFTPEFIVDPTKPTPEVRESRLHVPPGPAAAPTVDGILGRSLSFSFFSSSIDLSLTSDTR